MLSVILIWLYMGITTFIIGYGVLRVITRHLPYYAHVCTGNADDDKVCRRRGGRESGHFCPVIQTWDAYFMCGLASVTVYAQFFSLFSGVGLAANVILCVLCALTIMVDKRAFAETIRWLTLPAGKTSAGGDGSGSHMPDHGKPNDSLKVFRFCAVAALFLLFSYGTSRGMIHYDTGLYHAQSIRWIEEYGVVRGLGNLHCRLAYNSSSFALSALYSMAFLGGQSFHCAAGWLAFVLAAFCLPIGKSLRAGRLGASDFARLMCVYYLVNIFDEMISPASDYFMVLVAFYIVIKWLDLSGRGERTVFPYGLLCVLGVFLMTVKLSAALILLLTVYPACRLIREKRWGETGVYLGLGIVTALPFFIRNVVISGWFVYPFTQTDLFDVAWKIPKGIADYDAREIQVWGRGYTDVAQFDMPMREWLPGWFRTLAGSDKVLVFLAAAAVVLLLAAAMYLVRKSPALFTVQATVAASFLFWLCTSPLIRYGCVWVYLTAAVVSGGLYEMVMRSATGVGRSENAPRIQGRPGGAGIRGDRHGNGRGWRIKMERAASVFVVLFLLYKGFALARETAGCYVDDYWLVQKDYENYETRPYEIEGVTFYCPVEGDQVGYESFPSSPSEADIVFLGEGIADGFGAADRQGQRYGEQR